MRRLLLALLLTAATIGVPIQLAGWGVASAQWQILDSHTTADLRGIVNVGGGVAWASGSDGTILRTEDAGLMWQLCAKPRGGEHLDFRAVQAFDNNTAIAMSSGKGDQSRLYQTTDGCQTWHLVFTNPDKEGFWDALKAHVAGPFDTKICPSKTPVIAGAILGDPAIHKSNVRDTTTLPSFYLAMFTTNSSCSPDKLNPSATAIFSGPGEAAFAASNSVLYQLAPNTFWFATDREIIQYERGTTTPHHYGIDVVCPIDVPLQRGQPSQGVFSFAIRPNSIEQPKAIKFGHNFHCIKADAVAVGGDYSAPNNSQKTAAFTAGGNKFQAAATPPHGYRSAVAYDSKSKIWITVGPNGTDISTDDGRNWRALKPNPKLDPPDADQHWNALSLPFVVGPHGRIGLLRPSALQQIHQTAPAHP
ncbi:MAG TPA: hypothetical protein VHY48_09825 [Acidobacteriaceae bacterium]|jgi:hypothetical protein|nr:hypothetical protein [Acidobacteriaceae bacterium]